MSVQWLNAETKNAARRRSKHAAEMEHLAAELEREQAKLPLYAAGGALIGAIIGLCAWFIL
jgi:hypothetical protein